MTRQLPWPVLVLPQPWFTHCCWGFFSADFCEALLGARQGLPVFPGCKSSPPTMVVAFTDLPFPFPPFCTTGDPPDSLAADDLVSDSMGVQFI